MDLRIVNTCNNNCLYCLEQSLRKKEKFIDKYSIFDTLCNTENKDILSFYWWNPILHPDLLEIISYAKKIWFNSISILTNTYGLEETYIDKLIYAWINSVSVYFNCFSSARHNLITQGGIPIDKLLRNISLLNNRQLISKVIIHINKYNIDIIYKDIVVLFTKYKVTKIDFVNYFPFDRPYDSYKESLQYDILYNRGYIDKMLKVLMKLNIDTTFLKFRKDFFWVFQSFYDFDTGIKKQISEEDFIRIRWWNHPICYEKDRCWSCFIQDYGKCN